MSSVGLNYHPYYWSMMPYSSQASSYSSTPTSNKIVSNIGATEFSTQMACGVISGFNEAAPNAEGSTPACKKSPK